jgi:hypothetical protein
MNRMVVSTREAVRHALFKAGAYGALTWLRGKRGGTSAHLRAADAKARFQAIYDAGVWQHGDDGTPGSGFGSSLSATSTLRQILPSLLHEIGAQTLLDVGCGDFFWMQHVNLAQIYLGVDVVETVIEDNRKRFETPRRKFLALNAIVDDLPAADVVISREILFHLSFDDIDRLLRNILSKERSYILATSDRQTSFNSDIPTGDYRLLNLEARPLRFPPPLRIIDESAISPGRIIGLWDVKRLTAFRS